MLETRYLKNFLDDVGHSVHCMNTIAVSLSHLSNETTVPEELNISWKPGDVEKSKINARRFAIRSSIVYSIESLYEFLSKISKDSLWPETKKSYNELSEENATKAERVATFFSDIPDIKKEWIILVELLCHWRNKVVHANSSNANISKKSKIFLISKKQYIYDNYYHFDVALALDNFERNKFTLKDVTTLITIVIKCVRAIDVFFIKSVNSQSYDKIFNIISQNIEYKSLLNQQKSDKRDRQLKKWTKLHYGFVNKLKA